MGKPHHHAKSSEGVFETLSAEDSYINLKTDRTMTEKEQSKLENEALDQLLSRKSLFGKDGAFAPMLQSFIVEALED